MDTVDPIVLARAGIMNEFSVIDTLRSRSGSKADRDNALRPRSGGRVVRGMALRSRCGFKVVRDTSSLSPAHRHPNPPRFHLGDHSLTGDGMCPLNKLLMSTTVGQTLLPVLDGILSRTPNLLYLSEDGTQRGVRTRIVRNTAFTTPNYADFTGTFIKICPPTEPVFTLSTTHPVHVVTMSLDRISSVMPDVQNINGRNVAGLLTTALDLPYNVCQALSSYVAESRERVDMISLYAKGFALAEMKVTLDQWAATHENYPMAWNAPNNITFRNWSDPNIAVQFSNDIQARVIVCQARDFSEAQLDCLVHLAMSGIQLDEPEDLPRPRTNRINWFPIPIAVYFPRDAPNPVVRDFSPDSMRATLIALAHTRGELDAMVRGFVRACTVVNQVRRVGGGRISYFLPTLERAAHLIWPAPRDYNPLWRWLGYTPPPTTYGPFLGEAETIEARSMIYLADIMLLTSSLISLGSGLVCNKVNLGGQELNWINGQPNPPPSSLQLFATFFLRTESHQNSALPNFFRALCAEIADVTDMAINPTCFVQHAWNSSGVGMPVPGPETDWATWGPAIPYLLHPFSTAWALLLWPYTWGFFTGSAKLDLTSERILSGTFAGWYSDLGDRRYSAISRGEAATPYEYLPYSLAVINTLYQHFNRQQAPPNRVRVHHRGLSNPEAMPDRAVRPAWPADAWSLALHVLVPGYLRTYSWTEDCVYANYLAENDLGAGVWQLLRNQADLSLDNTGLLLPRVENLRGKITTPADFSYFYKDGEKENQAPPESQGNS